MTRYVAFILALVFASITVASACSASGPDWIRFTLEQKSGSGEIDGSFTEDRGGRGRNQWSNDFAPSQLIGLDVSGFRSGRAVPIRFAIIREAGRLDCSGLGGSFRASGQCGFTADAGFAQLLESRGIGRPTRDQSFTLMAIDARRELIDAVAAARYPTPRIDDLVSLTALGVNGDYIRGLARTGYRPSTLDSLVQFKALGISPDYVGGFLRIGYRNMAPDQLVQLKALDITPEYVAGFQRLGYRDLSADQLVQLKALDITPEFVASVQRERSGTRSVSELVDRKLFGRRN